MLPSPGFVLRRYGPRCTRRRSSWLEIFSHETVDDSIHPLAVPPVRPAARALVDEARALGMALRALVEPVDLELEPVQVELEQQVALKVLRRLVGKTAATKVRMDREISEVRNPRAAVNELEAHRAGASPMAVLLDLDHEATECVWLPLRTLDLLQQRRPVARPRRGKVRLDVLVRRQLDEEVDVGRLRAAQPEPVALDDAHGAGVAAAGSRDPNATPPRISTMPISSSTVSDSPGQGADVRGVRAGHQVSLEATRRARPRRTAPVPKPTPASTSARPPSAAPVTGSPSSTAP